MGKLHEKLSATAHENADDKYYRMTASPLGPLILSLAAPSIVSNLVTAIYNISDMYFVGMLGTSAAGAIGIAFVAMTAIQAVGFYFGQGVGNVSSRYLGAKRNEEARVFVSTGLACTFSAGIVIAILCNIFIEPICLIGGATPTILPYAETFISIIFIGAPFMTSSILLNMMMRFEGEALFSMLAMIAGNVLNICLTPLLMFVFNLGIAGSSISTVISQAVSFFLLVWEMQHISVTPLSWKYVHPSAKLFREVNQSGIPSFIRQVMLAVATTLLNQAAAPYGDAAVTAIAEVQRITGFANYVQIGIGQGFQPVCGYNIGAKNYGRVRKAYFYCIKVASIAVLTMGVVTCVFAPQIIWFFRADAEVVEIGTLTLRVTSFTIALTGAAMITNFGLQTSGHMWLATILGACRLGLILGPVVVVMSSCFGLLGVQLAQPVTDVLTALVAMPMAIWFVNELKRREQKMKADAEGDVSADAPHA